MMGAQAKTGTSGKKPSRTKKEARHAAAQNDFARWFDSCGLTAMKVAIEIERTPSYVYDLRAGRATPGRRLAIKIEEMTKGKVSVGSWDKD